MSVLSFKQVKKVYDETVVAVKDFSLEIEENEFIVLVGPSGCGKSTLLRMLAGLEEITAGEIVYRDRVLNDLAPSDRNIAMVFQNYALFSHLTVYDNIGFSKLIQRASSDTIYEHVRRASQAVGLDELLTRLPNQLSGGQRQRVALGRALVKNSGLLLMDEPLSNLDAKLRSQTRKELAKLHKAMNTTTIYVTHDQVEAMSLATRIVVLNEGEVMQIGAPRTVYHHPANTFVAQFIGTHPMNLLPAVVNGDKLMIGSESLTLNAAQLTRLESYQGKTLLVGFRAERVSFGTTGLTCTIQSSEYLGSQMIIKGKINNCPVILVCPGRIEIPPEMKVEVEIEALNFFDDKTKMRIA